MRDLDFKYMNFEKATRRLEEAVHVYDYKNDMIRDSIIQRFGFTYELAHKTLQAFMKYEGVTLENSFPRTIFKKAFANHLIEDEGLWLRLLEDRNATSHIYSEKLADEIAHRICKDYCSALKTLAQLIGQYIQASNSL